MSIFIGKHIKKILTEDDTLSRFVGDRVFPIVYAKSDDEAVSYPYIVYRRSNYQPEDIKLTDGCINVGAQTSVSIIVVGKTYEQFLNVCEAVTRICASNEMTESTYNEFEIKDCSFTIGEEAYDYDEGAYFTTFTLTFETE